MRWDGKISAFDSLGYEHSGRAIGRGGVLPAVVIPQSTKDVIGVDLTHVIHASDIEFAAAKGGNGGGKGGGKPGGDPGNGSSFDPYTSGDGDPANVFNITINFNGDGWTQELYDLFVAVADFYTDLIVGDVADVQVIGGGKPRTVDDIVIDAEITAIDGAGGILGQAGPTAIRTQGSLPANAIMQFDIADAADYLAAGLFDAIVFHEMGHSLGFGSIWDELGLVNEASEFTGALAMATSLAEFGTVSIAVEQDGGPGTADSHWDDDTYGNEIMTGYIDAGGNYLSDMSVASFGDLGYELAADWQLIADGFVFA